MNEAWHICVDFPAYEVSSRGRVRRRAFVRGKPPVVLPEWSGGSNDHQYPKVNLQKEGRGYKVFVHRLVGAAFYGLTRDHVIDHRNHNTHDLTQIRVALPRKMRATRTAGKIARLDSRAFPGIEPELTGMRTSH